MADDEWANFLLPPRAHVQKPRSFRRAQPLVAVPDVERRVEAPDIEVDHSGRVRTVDDRFDSLGLQLFDDTLDGAHDKTRWTRYMVNERKASTWSDARKYALDDLLVRTHGKGHIDNGDAGAVTFGHVLDYVSAGVVDVARDEDLVSIVERERSQDGVHARRRVGDPGE